MKLLILAACVALAAADVSHLVVKSDESGAEIRSQSLDVDVNGRYQWSIDTSNGISASEQGELKNAQSENAAEEVQGQATWISPEGETVSLRYIADENGYQPEGSHIPTPPPIPAAIARALEYIRAHPPKEERP